GAQDAGDGATAWGGGADMTLRVDRGDLDRWVAKMDQAISDTPGEAAKVVAKGALNIKNGARQRISGHPSAPAYPSSITYDTWMGLRGPKLGRASGREHTSH